MTGGNDVLILVDGDDAVVGYGDKAACHLGSGVRHRAFSAFLFDSQGRFLLQQRSAAKPLWGGYWSNSCCSHPRPGESVAQASRRRIREELGVTIDATSFLYKFEYYARFGQAGAEHELCHVVAGLVRDAPVPDPGEVAAWRFVSPAALDAQVREQPARFTPWFLQEWPRVRAEHGALLRAMLQGDAQAQAR